MADQSCAECSRCLLHSDIPGVSFNDGGLCSVCRDFDTEWGNWEEIKAQRRKQLEKMFDDCRRKGRPYDVLVPLSGGKDSTYVLYQCAKEFGLKVLAVTWDNGFLADLARENIRNAVDALGVSHVYYSMDQPRLLRFYRHFFLKTGMFCPVCMRGLAVATAAAAEAFNVPLQVNGTCRRTEEFVSPEFFNSGPIGFFKEAIKGSPLEKEADAFLYAGGRKRIASHYLFWWSHIERVLSSATIELPDYLDWDYDTIYRTLTDELGWQSERADEEHGDCLVSPLVHYLRQAKFPALVPEMLRYSKLVSAGIMTKEEARQAVADANQDVPEEPPGLDDLLSMLDITRAQLDEIIADPLRHMAFIKDEHGKLFRMARAIKRSVIPSKS